MPRDINGRLVNYAGLPARELNPERDGYCHPAPAKRTKCACGRTCELVWMSTRCECGRVHVREPGASAFQKAGDFVHNPIRPGGKKGCPGCWIEDPPPEAPNE